MIFLKNKLFIICKVKINFFFFLNHAWSKSLSHNLCVWNWDWELHSAGCQACALGSGDLGAGGGASCMSTVLSMALYCKGTSHPAHQVTGSSGHELWGSKRAAMETETGAGVGQAGDSGIPGVRVMWLGSLLGPAASNSLCLFLCSCS